MLMTIAMLLPALSSRTLPCNCDLLSEKKTIYGQTSDDYIMSYAKIMVISLPLYFLVDW